MIDKPYYCELLDFYQELLTDRQREICLDYYHNDLSLSEISENLGISKAAVGDIIKRVEKNLHYYESKLRLLEKHKKRMAISSEDASLYDKLIKIEEE